MKKKKNECVKSSQRSAKRNPKEQFIRKHRLWHTTRTDSKFKLNQANEQEEDNIKNKKQKINGDIDDVMLVRCVAMQMQMI